MLIKIAKIWVALNAIVFIAIGLLTIFRPKVVSSAIGYHLSGPQSVPEFMASYGGLLIAIGLVMFLGIFYVNIWHVLLATSIVYLGYAIGRILGVLLTGEMHQTTIVYLIYEVAALIITLLFSFNVQR